MQKWKPSATCSRRCNEPANSRDYWLWWNRRIQNNEVTLTEQEFIDLWKESGDWNNHGTSKDSTVMSRIDLNGIYELDNIELISKSEASKKAVKHRNGGVPINSYVRKKRPWTPERRAARSEVVKASHAAQTPEQRKLRNEHIAQGHARRKQPTQD